MSLVQCARCTKLRGPEDGNHRVYCNECNARLHREWVAEHPEGNAEIVRRNRARVAIPGERTREPWTQDEDLELKQLFSEGLNAREVADVLDRSIGAVHMRKHKHVAR